MRLLLIVGAKRHVVDIGLPRQRQRAVLGGHVGEPVPVGIGQPGGQPHRPGASRLHQRARDPRQKRPRLHVDSVLNGGRLMRHKVDQPRAGSRDQQRQVDTGRAHPRPRRPLIAASLAPVGIEGEQRDRHRSVDQGVPVHPPPRVSVGEPDADPEDVGAVAGRRPIGVDVGAARRHHQPPSGDGVPLPGCAVIVIDEVGPQQRPAGQAAGSAGARELLAKRPPGRRGKCPLRLQRRRRHPLGHRTDHDQLASRWRRCDRARHRAGHPTRHPQRQKRLVEQCHHVTPPGPASLTAPPAKQLWRITAPPTSPGSNPAPPGELFPVRRGQRTGRTLVLRLAQEVIFDGITLRLERSVVLSPPAQRCRRRPRACA